MPCIITPPNSLFCGCLNILPALIYTADNSCYKMLYQSLIVDFSQSHYVAVQVQNNRINNSSIILLMWKFQHFLISYSAYCFRWCGPCKHLTPRLEKVLNEHDKPVNLVKVDVDNFQDLAVKYRVGHNLIVGSALV